MPDLERPRASGLAGLLAGVVLLATSFATLFSAGPDARALLRRAGEPVGCSAWTACPGTWQSVDFSRTIAPLTVVGLVVAIIALATSWRVPLTVGYAVVAYLLLGLAAWQQRHAWVGVDETNHQFTTTPTAAFAVLALAIAAIPTSTIRAPGGAGSPRRVRWRPPGRLRGSRSAGPS